MFVYSKYFWQFNPHNEQESAVSWQLQPFLEVCALDCSIHMYDFNKKSHLRHKVLGGLLNRQHDQRRRRGRCIECVQRGASGACRLGADASRRPKLDSLDRFDVVHSSLARRLHSARKHLCRRWAVGQRLRGDVVRQLVIPGVGHVIDRVGNAKLPERLSAKVKCNRRVGELARQRRSRHTR